MNRLDRLIEWAAPEWGAKRKLARVALKRAEKLIGYKDGSPTIRDPGVQSTGASPDWSLEMGYDRREMVDRAQQMERDNALACSLLDRSVEHVIGDGFTLKCKSDDDKWNEETEEWWENWSQTADSRGILSFTEILQTVFRSWLRDGDIGCVLESDGTLRLVESNEIASKVGGYFKPSDADGVELDRRGRIVSYSVFDYDPTVLWPDRRRAIPRLVKVPAKDMIFLARRQRASQTRGISAFTGIMWLLEQLDDTIEAVAVAHHMAACFGLVLTKKNAFTGYSQGPDERGVMMPELQLGPGKIMRVDPGEDATQITPTQPGATFELLCDMLMRIASSRFSTPLEIVNYNFTKSNYSNMRASSIECAMAAKIKQTTILQQHFCTPIFGWKIANATVNGEVRPRKDAHKHVFGVPGQPWVDPEVEIRSAMASVDGCLDTRRAILARRGLDFDEVINELADENEKIEALDIDCARSNLTRDVVVPGENENTPFGQPAGEKPEKKKKAEKNGHNRITQGDQNVIR